jgi:hypothetical protein
MKRFVKKLFRKFGYEIEHVGRPAGASAPAFPPPASPYVENPEVGPLNLAEKLARVAQGEPFEWPNIVALNHAVASLVGDAKRIVELGSGTGCFGYEASADASRTVLCSELDREASRWSRENRSRPNLAYIDRPATGSDGPFDLVVAVEVIEHVADFNGFLRACRSLAPRALITTPNRQRGPRFDTAGPPPVAKHVREWSAGEFYWVLRCHWREVTLYGMPNPCAPAAVPICVTDTLSPLIADCRAPMRA